MSTETGSALRRRQRAEQYGVSHEVLADLERRVDELDAWMEAVKARRAALAEDTEEDDTDGGEDAATTADSATGGER